MLPKSVTQILDQWVNKTLINAPALSQYKPAPIPFIPGQFNIAVKREVRITYPGNSELVKVQKIFKTSSITSNVSADEYRLKVFLDVVDAEFIKKVFDTESRFSEELNPDGFF